VSSLIDIAFPYRRRRSFGAASFAFTFLVLLFEVELLAFVGMALVARQLQLWWDLQSVLFPTACSRWPDTWATARAKTRLALGS